MRRKVEKSEDGTGMSVRRDEILQTGRSMTTPFCCTARIGAGDSRSTELLKRTSGQVDGGGLPGDRGGDEGGQEEEEEKSRSRVSSGLPGFFGNRQN